MPRDPVPYQPGLARPPGPRYLPDVHPHRTIEPRGGGISDLTSKQRAHLRSLAHDLKAILQVGSAGITGAVLESVEEAFANRELLKVKVLDGAPEGVDETADAIRDGLDGVHVVQTIGRTMVLYRPFPEEPEIPLPD